MNDYELYFPAGFSLETSSVLLRRMEKQDFYPFLPISKSASTWTYFTKQLDDETELKEWVKQAVDETEKQTRVAFTVIEKASNKICGSTSYGNISFYDSRLEIGWTWLSEEARGTGINQHTKYALLKFAFENMLFERVEIKTDNLNERAKQALRKIGAKEEGVLRSHMLMPHGRRRDSVYFSILKNEWPLVKQQFFKDLI
jgi:N-acetyltransferase